MTADMLHVMEWHNGDKDYSPFSDAEMKRRQDDVRGWMAANDVDAALFTSYHCINYYSGWLYCYFGRKYGMVDHPRRGHHDLAPGSTAASPGGAAFGGNVTYTDWRRDNFYRAVRQLTPGVKRLGIEFDHVNLDYRKPLEAALPGVEFVDIAAGVDVDADRSSRPRNIALIRTGARICDVGGCGLRRGDQGGRARA